MPIFFADDSNLFKNGKSISDIENELNEELSEIVRWSKINKLTLNVDKTQCMFFQIRNAAQIWISKSKVQRLPKSTKQNLLE